MGNCLSTSYQNLDSCYQKNWPKATWLNPVYLTSGAMLAVAACAMTKKKALPQTNFTRFVFLSTLGSTLGFQRWFVLKDIARSVVSREQFETVSAFFLPKYFFIVSSTTCAALVVYLRTHPFSTWKDDTCLMGGLLAGSFVLNVVNYTCFSVNAAKYMKAVAQFEKGAPTVNVLGKSVQDTKAITDPAYHETLKKSARFQCYTLGGHLLSLAATTAQFYLLASRNFNLFSF